MSGNDKRETKDEAVPERGIRAVRCSPEQMAKVRMLIRKNAPMFREKFGQDCVLKVR